MNISESQLGWTPNHKLTVNGKPVRSAAWYEGFVSLSTDDGSYTMSTDAFEQFVSPEWDPNKPWFYTSPR